MVLPHLHSTQADGLPQSLFTHARTPNSLEQIPRMFPMSPTAWEDIRHYKYTIRHKQDLVEMPPFGMTHFWFDWGLVIFESVSFSLFVDVRCIAKFSST